MNRDETSELLRHAARRAARHPFFLAADLEDFRFERQMEEADLAQFLHCTPELLPRLGLCRRPEPESPGFRDDVHLIAAAFGLEPTQLAQLIRETAALRALRGADRNAGLETGRGLLMAARDADPDESLREPEPQEPGQEPDQEPDQEG